MPSAAAPSPQVTFFAEDGRANAGPSVLVVLAALRQAPGAVGMTRPDAPLAANGLGQQ